MPNASAHLWIKENGKYIYEIEIPANCTADLILPDGKKETLLAGTYKITE